MITDYLSENLRIIFEALPNKSAFLERLHLAPTFSGFRHFMLDLLKKPSDMFLNTLSAEMGYHLVLIPIKIGEEGDAIKKELDDKFLEDVKTFTDVHNTDIGRIFLKDFGGISSVASACADEAFSGNLDDLKVEDLF